MSEPRVKLDRVEYLAGLPPMRDSADEKIMLAADLLAAREEIERLKGEGGASLLEMDDEEFEDLLQSMREMRGMARVRSAAKETPNAD